jgi:hypothetical protein
LTRTSIRPKRSTVSATAASRCSAVEDIELDDVNPIVAGEFGEGLGVARGGHHAVTPSEGGADDRTAESARGAGDQPDPVVAHSS